MPEVFKLKDSGSSHQKGVYDMCCESVCMVIKTIYGLLMKNKNILRVI